jgi:hypothetical protein
MKGEPKQDPGEPDGPPPPSAHAGSTTMERAGSNNVIHLFASVAASSRVGNTHAFSRGPKNSKALSSLGTDSHCGPEDGSLGTALMTKPAVDSLMPSFYRLEIMVRVRA